ncbi:MAG: SDR family NAD(P)-dependent oxidoreductase [Cellulomonas sp.]|uniref:SDR family NAD(P)-dependent oxidoreductase n=1 Tax=Cellulomonas sp. TaxID=40001 RepID=UPI001A0E9E57|nr:SDR family NAD(P)-dependent oxidoreductase [Cellulomonas sp.]MBF0689688.1 SDR family NAD(P)-dependent oxidoreductase [Cellulomonas sp.]
MTGPVLITGATGGLGQATARAVAREGHPLLLVVRDLDRGEVLARTLREAAPGLAVSVRRADLADLSSVRALADGLIREDLLPRAVVCNAGLQVVDGIQRSPDGYELTMATNVLGHVALLAPILERMGPGSRVVTIGSETHRGGPRAFGFPAARWTDMATLLRPPPGTPAHPVAGRVRYSTSKLACIALAYGIDARWRGRGVRAVAFDPGLMPETGLARQYPPRPGQPYQQRGERRVGGPDRRGVPDSAADLAWQATAEEAEPLMGRYVSQRRARRSSVASYRSGLGAQIWDACLEAAGVEPTGA